MGEPDYGGNERGSCASGACVCVCVCVCVCEGRGGRYERAGGVTSPVALGRFVV